MVINNFYVIGVALLPAKADAPLRVDAYAVLALPVTMQLFQPVPRRHAQRIDIVGCIEHVQLAQGNMLDVPVAA